MIKAVIFDCWGTLFHDDTVNQQPFVELSHRLGKNLGTDYEYLKVFEHIFMLKKCDHIDDQMHELLDKLGKTVSDTEFDCLLKVMKKVNGPKKAYPDVLENLAELRKAHKLALVTNSFSIGMERLERDYDLNLYFDVILRSYETGLLKPDPKIFELALAKLEVRKEEVIMVGDSLNDDIKAADKFGIKAILLDRRNRYPEYKKQKIGSLNELRKLFE